ncbi:putative methyltransferase PMT20 [Wolffia australiana]
MRKKDSKAERRNFDRSPRVVSLTLIFIALCGFSFYLGGIYYSNKNKILPTSNPLPSVKEAPVKASIVPLQIKGVHFPVCSKDLQDYTPCTDPKRWFSYNRDRLSYLERHCPARHKRKECLIPPPDGYKVPIRWPKSKNECWYRNVPYDWINNEKANQNWLRKVGEKFIFPGGGTMFPDGVSAYVDVMQSLIPGMKDGSIRTAIDTGCGVASWGGDLLNRGILTMSLAPRDNHEAQVQFALERGIPAILGIISTQRLPFPANSFDMAHCSRCLIPWAKFGGLYLLEIHRILRPGGFWVLSGPPVNYQKHWKGWETTAEAQKSNLDRLQSLLTSMCFKFHGQKGDIAVWQKTTDSSCYANITTAGSDHRPARCDDGTDPDDAWYVPLRPCVTVPDPGLKKLAIGVAPRWPQRLTTAPERVAVVPGGHAGGFNHDTKKWKERVKWYKSLLPALGTDKVRNVMDMNTVYGGLAAALVDDPVWVMNVVSSYGVRSLGAVFDRGLIGTYHDWCEAFSTYPRTYDLLHLDRLFTDESHRCEMKLVMLEMDRIVRPGGYVVIRESSYFVDAIATLAQGLRWGCRANRTEYAAVEKEKLLICQKKIWYSAAASR